MAAAYEHRYKKNQKSSESISFPGVEKGLLSSFFFAYDGTDHHVKEIGLIPSAGKLHTKLADKNGDDKAHYYGGYAFLGAEAEAKIQYKEISGKALGSVSVTIQVPADHVFALRGFHLDRLVSDFQPHSIAVWMDNGELRVTFRDEKASQGENYNFSVRLRPRAASILQESESEKQLPASIHSLLDQARRRRAGRASPQKGIKVIHGFWISFAGGDHHLKGIGVNSAIHGDPAGTTMYTTMHDKNGDDLVRGVVSYGLL